MKIRKLYFASVSFRGFGSTKQPKRISFQDFLISVISKKARALYRETGNDRIQFHDHKNEVFERFRLQREIEMLVKKGKKTVKLRKVPCLPKLQTSRPRLTVLLKIESFDNIIWYKKCCHFNFGQNSSANFRAF